jgi:hypothetical protein
MFLNTELILNSDATLLPEAHPDVVRTMPVPSKLVEGRQEFYISIHVALKTPYSCVLQCDKSICLLLVLTCFMGCFSGDAWAFDSHGFVGRLSYDPQTKYYNLEALLASCACVGFCNCNTSRHYFIYGTYILLVNTLEVTWQVTHGDSKVAVVSVHCASFHRVNMMCKGHERPFIFVCGGPHLLDLKLMH